MASLGSAGLSLPLMPKYQCLESGEMRVTGLRGVKELKALDPPRVKEVKDQVRDKVRQQMSFPRGELTHEFQADVCLNMAGF